MAMTRTTSKRTAPQIPQKGLTPKLSWLIKRAFVANGITHLTQREGHTYTRISRADAAELVAPYIVKHLLPKKVCIRCGNELPGLRRKYCSDRCERIKPKQS